MKKNNIFFNFQENHSVLAIRWWVRVLLWVRKPYYGYDYGSDDKSIVMTFKKLKGKIYLIDEKRD